MKCTRFKRLKKGVFPAFILFSLFLSVSANAQDEEIPLYLESSEDSLINVDPDSSYASPADLEQPTTFSSPQITPDEAYRQLVAGNARYLREDSSEARELPKYSHKESTYPIATILYSLDMPVLPTTLTQTTDHDVYLSGVKAGAVSSDDLAAVEYGLLNLQTPLLVVVGHYPSRDVSNLIRKYDALEKRAEAEAAKITSSGVKTLPQGTTSEEMKLYNLVGPAIARSKKAYPDLQGYELANIVSEALVWQSLETILMKSTVTQDLVRAGKLNLIAAIADDSTGKIYWLGEHPLQEEFLKATPEELRNIGEQNEILTDSALSTPLSDAQVREYVSLYESNTYYNDVIDDYYIQPEYYVPSWELFSTRAWLYRPWYGVWVEPFTPWPYWQPWGYPPETPGLDVSLWDGRLNFFIGYNRYSGPYRPWDPYFRPRSSWWNVDVFLNPSGHWRDPIFDLVWRGLHNDIRHVPFDQRPLHHPAGPRPEPSSRPGSVRPMPQPGGPTGAPANPNGSPGRYRPGDARPGIVTRLGSWGIGPKPNGSGIGGGFFRPGNQPNPSTPGPGTSAPERTDSNSRLAPPGVNDKPDRPENPGANNKPNRPQRPGVNDRPERPGKPGANSGFVGPNSNEEVNRPERPNVNAGSVKPNAGNGINRPGRPESNSRPAGSRLGANSTFSGTTPESTRPDRRGVTPITGTPTTNTPRSLGTMLESPGSAASVRPVPPNASGSNQNPSTAASARRQGRFGDSFGVGGMRPGDAMTPEARPTGRPASISTNIENRGTSQPEGAATRVRPSGSDGLSLSRPGSATSRSFETSRITSGSSAFPPRNDILARPSPPNSNSTSRPTPHSALRPSTLGSLSMSRPSDSPRSMNPRPSSLSGSSGGLNRPAGPIARPGVGPGSPGGPLGPPNR